MNDMATQTFYRAANVSSAEATTSLFRRFPKAELIGFEKKVANANEAKSAGVTEGELVYAATVRVAEFPSADDAGDDTSEPKSDKAPPAHNSDSDPDDDGDDDSSTKDDSDSDHDFSGKDKGEGEGDGGEGAKPKKLSPDEQIVHLLTQILDALKGGGAPGDPMGDPGDLDLPDVGAPDQGEGLPPAPGMGGPPGKAPLPPPVKEKGPVGVGAFAHVAGKAEISMVRADAGEVNNSAIITEASTYAPTHRVAKIQRTGYATLNGEEVYLPEARLAVVTLVAK